MRRPLPAEPESNRDPAAYVFIRGAGGLQFAAPVTYRAVNVHSAAT